MIGSDYKHITRSHHRARKSQSEYRELRGFIVALIVTVVIVHLFGW